MILKTLNMTKGGYAYVFRYAPGCEDGVAEQMTRLAGDPGTNFDWLDAAKGSFRVTHALAADCMDAIDGGPTWSGLDEEAAPQPE